MAPTLSADRLTKCTTAMQRVYKFPTPSSSSSTPEPWTPPPASAGHRGRYLWTDAFGLLNFLTLHRLTGAAAYLAHATALARAVHDVLGRTRDGSARLPGASDADPLGGGLRIGKEDAVGPDADGQYHHYLTLWMLALSRLAAAWRREAGAQAEAARWNGLAVRLMEAVHPAFVYDRERERPRMYWKVSMGLERPLVTSEGNLDPVDGLVVCKVLRETEGNANVLERETQDYEKIVAAKWKNYVSDDPLDLGMTLWTAHQYAGKEEWAVGLVERAGRDLKELVDSGYLRMGVRRRLAFREFGTVLGIRCALAHEPGWEEEAEKITKIWEEAGVVPEPKDEAALNLNTSADLTPITLVMYAAAVEPGAFRRGWLES